MDGPRYRWTSFARSDVGLVRRINEDACLARPDSGLWAVADGMGGHAFGEVASAMVVDALAALADTGGPPTLDSFADAVRLAMQVVNHALREQAVLHDVTLVGSTVVILLAREGQCAVLWAGDSRAYRMRAGRLEQLTQDHSHVMPRQIDEDADLTWLDMPIAGGAGFPGHWQAMAHDAEGLVPAVAGMGNAGPGNAGGNQGEPQSAGSTLPFSRRAYPDVAASPTAGRNPLATSASAPASAMDGQTDPVGRLPAAIDTGSPVYAGGASGIGITPAWPTVPTPATAGITRAVGAADALELEEIRFPLDDGDVFLLCSDGLTREVDVADIARLLAPGNSRHATQALIALALQQGGRDNVSVVVAAADDLWSADRTQINPAC